jgi:hypothetical protein
MNYQEALKLLPNATYIYYDVTDEETDLALHKRYIAYTPDNKIVLGSGNYIEELLEKLIVKEDLNVAVTEEPEQQAETVVELNSI